MKSRKYEKSKMGNKKKKIVAIEKKLYICKVIRILTS